MGSGAEPFECRNEVRYDACRERIEPPPAHVVAFLAQSQGIRGPRGSHCRAHEVLHIPVLAAHGEILIEAVRMELKRSAAHDLEVFKPRLLENLAPRGLLEALLARVDMPAELEPCPCLLCTSPSPRDS